MPSTQPESYTAFDMFNQIFCSAQAAVSTVDKRRWEQGSNSRSDRTVPGTRLLRTWGSGLDASLGNVLTSHHLSTRADGGARLLSTTMACLPGQNHVSRPVAVGAYIGCIFPPMPEYLVGQRPSGQILFKLGAACVDAVQSRDRQSDLELLLQPDQPMDDLNRSNEVFAGVVIGGINRNILAVHQIMSGVDPDHAVRVIRNMQPHIDLPAAPSLT